jgi:hypothetical protein
MLWPRTEAYYDDETTLISGIPTELKKAVAEFAVKSANADIFPDRDSNGAIKKVTNKVDVITNTIEYAGPGELINANTDPYPSVTAILSGILNGYVAGLVAEPVVMGLTYSNLNENKDNPDAYTSVFSRDQFNNDGPDSNVDWIEDY